MRKKNGEGMAYGIIRMVFLLGQSRIRRQPVNTNLALNHSGLGGFLELFIAVSHNLISRRRSVNLRWRSHWHIPCHG